MRGQRSEVRGQRAARRQILIAALCLLTSVLGLAACTSRQLTLAPLPVKSTQASWEGNEQTSGIISVDEHGFKVTQHFIARYDALLALYGARLAPAIKPGDRAGVTEIPPYFRITGEVQARFNLMNRWRKAEMAP